MLRSIITNMAITHSSHSDSTRCRTLMSSLKLVLVILAVILQYELIDLFKIADLTKRFFKCFIICGLQMLRSIPTIILAMLSFCEYS